MKLIQRHALSFTLLVAVGGIATLGRADSTGTIRGIVTDLKGKPISEATVFTGGAVRPRTATSASDGTFELTNVPSGRVYLLAYKESDGYPNNVDNFFSMPGEEFPSVEVIPDRTTEGVVVQLGEAAAYLSFDVSGENGKPIDTTAYFWRPDHDKGPEDWSFSMNIGAHQKNVMVPPVPFEITLTAEGFDAWRSGTDERYRGGGFIHLQSGQTLPLHVHLNKSR